MEPITASSMTYLDNEGYVEFYPPQDLAWRDWRRDDDERPGLMVCHKGGKPSIRVLTSTSDGWEVQRHRVLRDAADYASQPGVDSATAEFVQLFVRKFLSFLKRGVIPWR